jgi:hypothetical protein
MRNSECGTRNGSERLRALNIPRRVQVELGPDGLPKAVGRSGGQAVGDYTVEAVIEAWRIDDEWWRSPISRRYHEVVLHSGGRVVLFQDLITDEWFIQMP